jgi:type II secretory pathway component PulJ
MRTSSSRRSILGFTIVETMVAVGIGSAILVAFTIASVAMQRSFMAIQDYTKGLNDQMRISDYLALDMRRAYTISITGTCASPPLTVTMTIPNFYASADTPNNPKITGVTGWPYKKHHHHHHQNIILNQVVDYAPSGNSAATSLTVTYVFNNSAYTLTRTVTQTNGTVVTQTIASDVKDFCVTVSDLDETATTQITFQPRFRSTTASSAITGTTYYQTTLTRNTR